MSTISAILEPDADGTLHLPLPPELRNCKVKVEAKVEAVGNPVAATGTVLDALREIRALGGLNDVIPDPMAWQRDMRKDRPLPGRE